MPLKLSIHQEHTKHAASAGTGRVWHGGFGIEQGVVDHELAASIEHVRQRDLPAVAFEGVVLVQQLSRQLAPLPHEVSAILARIGQAETVEP